MSVVITLETLQRLSSSTHKAPDFNQSISINQSRNFKGGLSNKLLRTT